MKKRQSKIRKLGVRLNDLYDEENDQTTKDQNVIMIDTSPLDENSQDGEKQLDPQVKNNDSNCQTIQLTNFSNMS